MELFVEKKPHTFFYKIWLFITIIAIFYSFFFQYAVKAIGGAMFGLCAFLILFGFVQVFFVQKGRVTKSYFDPIVLFVIISVIFTLGFTAKGYGTDLSVRMIEYVLTSYSIYLLLRECHEYIEIVFWGTSLAITLLALATFIKGVAVSSSGAIGLEGLNSNSMSSFLLIMYFTSFCLLYKKRRFLIRVLLLSMIAVVAVAQVSAASRRGFIVLVLFTFLSLVFGIIPLKSENKSKRRYFFYVLLLLGIGIALIFLQNYLLEKTLLGARLMGAYDGGDVARNRYQTFALQQFKEHPLLGIGLGGVAFHMGAYSHSLYYELLACTGILITPIFAYGIMKMFRAYWLSNRFFIAYDNQKANIYFSRIGFIFLFCILISGIAVVMIYDFHFYYSLALIVALLSRLKDSWKIEYGG